MPSASKRPRVDSFRLELPHEQNAPSIAGLFLVRFDIRQGYTIAWQRSLGDLELENSVEYRSLPSGLHEIESDVIYFTHDDEFVGISAYRNKASQDADRGSTMLAVGVLLPSSGQLGKAWLHIDGLKHLAEALADAPGNTQILEEYWDQYRDPSQGDDQGPPSPLASKDKQKETPATSNGSTHVRNRAVSSASALVSHEPHGLSSNHPATSLHYFIDTFGPLVFAIYKIALLRRRILFIVHAPVEEACKFVYDCSLISGIPIAASESIPLDPLPIRLRALYNVGLHDMDALGTGNETGHEFGWVACTTDNILSQKTQLFDYVIRLPPAHARNAEQKVWPSIHNSKGIEVKATQRDLRRYRVLRREIAIFDSPPSPNLPATDLGRSFTAPKLEDHVADSSDVLDADLAEKKSLLALAYDGFLWWAAAGEKRADLDEEEQQDAALLHRADDEGSPNRSRSGGKSPLGMLPTASGPAGLEITVVAFFHRLTSQILTILSDVVSDADDASVAEDGQDDNDEDDIAAASADSAPLVSGKENEQRPLVQVEADDMSRMGLDLWSQSDRAFVEDLISLYWGRKANVARTPGIECCGMRIC